MATSKTSLTLRSTTFNPTLNLSNLNGTNGFCLDGVKSFDQSGHSVSGVGDVNGDGFADLIVGAIHADPNGKDKAGSSYVVFGKASGFKASVNLGRLDGTDGFRLDGVKSFNFFGDSVSGAGNVNGDGFDDLIISAPGAYSSYVVFGRASGFGAKLSLGSLDGTAGFRLDGLKSSLYTVSSVSGAGDVNGDGFDDLIVGVDNASPNGKDGAGSSYVVFGKASGFRANVNLSRLNGSNGFRLDGAAPGNQSGASVSSAGDVNGDGFDDLIIGAPNDNLNGQRQVGSSYVVFGKASGSETNLSLGSVDGTTGFRLDGVRRFDQSGYSVSGAGDVNNDGFDDLIIGGAKGTGPSYVVFGKASSFESSVNLAELNGANGFRLSDGTESDFGSVTGYSVSSAGDFNGDSFDDLIIGARATGLSYVVFGKASSFKSSVNLAKLNGTNGFRLKDSGEDLRGQPVSGAGDINGDGFDDLIIGAPYASPDLKDFAGSSYVVFGRATTQASLI